MARSDGSGVSLEQFATVLAPLNGAGAAALSRAEMETRLWSTPLSSFRRLSQDHLDLRASREPRSWRRPRAPVPGRGRPDPCIGNGLRAGRRDADRVPGAWAEETVPRRRRAQLAQRTPLARAAPPGRGGNHPRAFGDVVDAVNRATGQYVGNVRSRPWPPGPRSTTTRSTRAHKPLPGANDDVLVISCVDGKTVVNAPGRAKQGHR